MGGLAPWPTWLRDGDAARCADGEDDAARCADDEDNVARRADDEEGPSLLSTSLPSARAYRMSCSLRFSADSEFHAASASTRLSL